MTPFELTLQSELDVEWQRFVNKWLFPWHGMTYRGGVTDVEDFRGGRIRYSGIKFGAQQQQIYWQAIGRYLNQKVHETFKRWDEATHAYPGESRKASLGGTSDCLHRFAAKIIRDATETDRRLRGQGFPDKADPFDATRFRSEANAEIERLKTAHLDLMLEGKAPEKVVREPTPRSKPIIFISYAHADEPERPAEGEVKWLSFVTGYLRPAVKHGAVEIWIDALMKGGTDWEREIERKLRACDVFILLISRHSMASDYIVDKEIAIIRERQAKGEDVHFYPLLLTPTPKIALDKVRDKNLRPRDGKPFSGYSINERYQHMSDAADEIVEIAERMSVRNSFGAVRGAGLREPEAKVKDAYSLRVWLDGQSTEVAITIAARAALRTLPLAVRSARKRPNVEEAGKFAASTIVSFRAGAIAHVVAKYPARASEFRELAAAAPGAIATAFPAAQASAAAVLTACVASSLSGGGDATVRTVLNAVDFAASASVLDAAAAGTGGSVAQSAAWEEVRSDIAAFQNLGANALAELPLWSRGAPEWAEDAWAALQAALPRGADWEVWIEWYEERLRGGSRGETYEVIFASVPPDVWEKGPAAANAWIRGHLPKGPGTASPPDLPQPLPSLDSPFTYAWNAASRVAIVAGAQNLPFYPFFTSEEDHRHSLEACRVGAERLLKSLSEGRFHNVRPEYAETLAYYVEDLPKTAGTGNILLAYDQVIVLHAMFAQDADQLPAAFTGKLARVIANQFALNGFYDLVQRHEQAVNAANWAQPFPTEVAKRFFGVVEQNTPHFFEPEVAEGVQRVELSMPPVVLAPDERPKPSPALQPPPLPAGAPDTGHSRQRQIATSANALYEVFLKGKDLPLAIEGWTRVAHSLGEHIGPILNFLRGLGTPL